MFNIRKYSETLVVYIPDEIVERAPEMLLDGNLELTTNEALDLQEKLALALDGRG